MSMNGLLGELMDTLGLGRVYGVAAVSILPTCLKLDLWDASRGGSCAVCLLHTLNYREGQSQDET